MRLTDLRKKNNDDSIFEGNTPPPSSKLKEKEKLTLQTLLGEFREMRNQLNDFFNQYSIENNIPIDKIGQIETPKKPLIKK